MNEKRFWKKYTIAYTRVHNYGGNNFEFSHFIYIKKVKRGIKMKEKKYIHYINDAIEKDNQAIILITDPKAVKAAFDFAKLKHMDTLVLLIKPSKISILRQYYEGIYETHYTQYFDKDFNSHIFVIKPIHKY